MRSHSKAARHTRARPGDAAAHDVAAGRNSERPKPAPCGSMPARTSPFRFYQFWLNVGRSRRRDLSEIFHVQVRRRRSPSSSARRSEHPERREAQRELARDVTTMVHGADQVARAERAASVLFGGSLADATVDDILMMFDDAPSISIAGASLESGHRRGGACGEGRVWRRRRAKPAA